MTRRLGRSLGMALVVASMLVWSVTTFAPVENRRNAGTGKDPTGGVIPGAAVTVKNEKTGEMRATTSNQAGYFVVASLKPSTYSVKVVLQGFTPVEFTKV